MDRINKENGIPVTTKSLKTCPVLKRSSSVLGPFIDLIYPAFLHSCLALVQCFPVRCLLIFLLTMFVKFLFTPFTDANRNCVNLSMHSLKVQSWTSLCGNLSPDLLMVPKDSFLNIFGAFL